MSEGEDIQDEGDTLDLIVWEEWIEWVKSGVRVGPSQPKIEDRSCPHSQHDSP